MNTEVIANLLATKSLGTVGTDIFAYSGPDGWKKGLLVIDNLLGTPLDEDLPGYKRASFRVIVRDIDYQAALATAKAVSVALNIYRETHGSLVFKRMRPECDPIPYAIPESDIIEIAVNMQAIYCEFS